MRNLKRMGAMMMALVLAFSLSVTAFAAVEDTGFADVAADAWYAEAVEYVRDNGLMSGTSATTFAPNDTMTRSMLATTLYREAGSPRGLRQRCLYGYPGGCLVRRCGPLGFPGGSHQRLRQRPVWNQ